MSQLASQIPHNFLQQTLLGLREMMPPTPDYSQPLDAFRRTTSVVAPLVFPQFSVPPALGQSTTRVTQNPTAGLQSPGTSADQSLVPVPRALASTMGPGGGVRMTSPEGIDYVQTAPNQQPPGVPQQGPLNPPVRMVPEETEKIPTTESPPKPSTDPTDPKDPKDPIPKKPKTPERGGSGSGGSGYGGSRSGSGVLSKRSDAIEKRIEMIRKKMELREIKRQEREQIEQLREEQKARREAARARQMQRLEERRKEDAVRGGPKEWSAVVGANGDPRQIVANSQDGMVRPDIGAMGPPAPPGWVPPSGGYYGR